MVGALSALLLGVVLLVSTAPDAVAAVSPGGAEREFLQLLNRERIDRGLVPLASDPLLIPIAREWSATMANRDDLSHRGDLRAQVERRVTRDWQRIGENVGVGGAVKGLHDAFMASPGHKANVVGDYNRVGVGVVVDGPTTWVTFNFLKGSPIVGATGMNPPAGDLWVASEAGEVWAFGRAVDHGSLAGTRLAAPVVGMSATPSRKGYWLVAGDGGVFTFGDARFLGSTGGMRLNRPIVGMAPTPSGRGYWLVASDGGVFSYGDARFFGSTGSTRLNRPIVGMTPTPTGLGYWLVASDGGVFAYGDAGFFGSTGAMRLNQPITGIGATDDGRGYWLIAADGGVFSFGAAPFHGSTGGRGVTAAVTDVAVTGSGGGYRMVGHDGRVYSFGNAGRGASDPLPTARPVVAVASAS